MATLRELLSFHAVKVQCDADNNVPGIWFIKHEEVDGLIMDRVFTVDEEAIPETLEHLEKLIQLDKLEVMSWDLGKHVIFRIIQ